MRPPLLSLSNIWRRLENQAKEKCIAKEVESLILKDFISGISASLFKNI
jgi:hypothetical protein